MLLCGLLAYARPSWFAKVGSGAPRMVVVVLCRCRDDVLVINDPMWGGLMLPCGEMEASRSSEDAAWALAKNLWGEAWPAGRCREPLGFDWYGIRVVCYELLAGREEFDKLLHRRSCLVMPYSVARCRARDVAPLGAEIIARCWQRGSRELSQNLEARAVDMCMRGDDRRGGRRLVLVHMP